MAAVITAACLRKLSSLALTIVGPPQAAERIGVGRTLFKKVCRKHGIAQWPGVGSKQDVASGKKMFSPRAQAQPVTAAPPPPPLPAADAEPVGEPGQIEQIQRPPAVKAGSALGVPRSNANSRRQATKPAGIQKLGRRCVSTPSSHLWASQVLPTPPSHRCL